MGTGGQVGADGATRPVERLVLSGDEVLVEEITTAWAPPPGVPLGQAPGKTVVTVGSGLAFAPFLLPSAAARTRHRRHPGERTGKAIGGVGKGSRDFGSATGSICRHGGGSARDSAQ